MVEATSNSTSILQLVNKTLELPTIPEVLVSLNDVIASDDSTSDDVAEVIAKDPAVSANVLRIVNSAYYGLQVRVSSISLAVSVLGFSMTKKVALASAMIHAPKVLVLDEPFEAVDPVSAANIRDILAQFVQSGGTVIVSSHVMDLVQRMCDHVAIIAQGNLLAAGTVDEVRDGQSLEDRFVDLVGGRSTGEGLSWLRT